MQTIEVSALSEAQWLEQLEAEIEAGIELIARGSSRLQRALAEIRGNRLWESRRDGFGNQVYQSFEHYCRVRLGLSKSSANEHALAGKIALEMLEAGTDEGELPTATAPMLELSKVEPERRADVLAAASSEGTPTAQRIEKAAKIALQPKAGQSYRVSSPENLHHGSIVQVSQVRGNVAVAAIGNQDYPFLPAELELIEVPEKGQRQAVPEAQPKLSLREQNARLKALLRRIIEECDITGALLAEIREAL